MASVAQLAAPVSHSLISSHAPPVSANPLLQVHTTAPVLSLQAELAGQAFGELQDVAVPDETVPVKQHATPLVQVVLSAGSSFLVIFKVSSW